MPQFGANSLRITEALAACPLYFILDSSLLQLGDPVTTGKRALAAGVGVMQLRLSSLPSREWLKVAERMEGACAKAGCVLLINDRVDIALLSGADGVHLGADDVPVGTVRRTYPQLIIGATVRNPRAAREAQAAGADYLGCGSVYPSWTKPGLPVIGTAGLAKICKATSLPVVGIGGVTEENYQAVLEAGADGVCSIGAFQSGKSVGVVVAAFKHSHGLGAAD